MSRLLWLWLAALGAGGASDASSRPSSGGGGGGGARRHVVGVHDCGWGGNWHNESGEQHIRWPMLTELCASSYASLHANGTVAFAVCGKPGSFQQAEYTAMRAAAKQHAVRWTFNLAVPGFTNAALTAFLNDNATRAAAVASLVGLLEEQKADGLMLDFEGAYEWDPVLAPRLLGWFAELRAGLTAAGMPDATLSLPQGQCA